MWLWDPAGLDAPKVKEEWKELPEALEWAEGMTALSQLDLKGCRDAVQKAAEAKYPLLYPELNSPKSQSGRSEESQSGEHQWNGDTCQHAEASWSSS